MKIAVYGTVEKRTTRMPDIPWEQGIAEAVKHFGMTPEQIEEGLLAGYASTPLKDWIAIDDDGTLIGEVTVWCGKEIRDAVRHL